MSGRSAGVVAIWRAYTRPGQLARARGFFHVVGLAAYNPGDFREFIDSLDDLTTMLASLAEREGHDTKEALRMATVALILRMSKGRSAPRRQR